MKHLRSIFFALAPLLALVALTASQLPAHAAGNPNLLKGHNPRFEQGLADWTILQGSGDTLVAKTVNGSAKNGCGDQVLLTKGNTGTASVSSAFVPLVASTDYRFTIWLKVKGVGTVAQVIAYEQDPAYPADNVAHVLAADITTTDGKWQKITGTFTSMEIASEGRIVVAFTNGELGKLSMDCAVIKPIPASES
jgi:hypothetical protein